MEVLIEEESVKSEFVRWCKHFGDNDPYAISGNIGIRDVLRAHFLIADYFFNKGVGMGGIGPRDPNLLHSAVYRQFTGYAGRDKWETTFERCATLVFGLVKDHPFHDANKRTALLVLLYFLSTIKRVPTVDQKTLEQFIVEIAEDNLKKYRRLKSLEARTDDPEIYFIADWIRRNSRELDTRQYTITFRELEVRLREFNYAMTNAHDNFIDICKVEENRGLFGLGKLRTKLTKVVQVGFPGWKRQVDRGALKAIRKATNLTAEKGIDSQAFYRGTDPLQSLIAEYSGPLERLAQR